MAIKKKDIIAVVDSNGEETEEKWEVLVVSGNKVTAKPSGENGEKNKKTFHCSRVTKCNNKTTNAFDIAARQTSLNSKHKVKKGKNVKQMSTKTSKQSGTKLDLKDLTKDGSELWVKKSDGSGHNSEVKSYTLISANKKSFITFQLYNGSLGKNSGTYLKKKPYKIKGKNGYEKKIKNLKKKNYKKVA